MSEVVECLPPTGALSDGEIGAYIAIAVVLFGFGCFVGGERHSKDKSWWPAFVPFAVFLMPVALQLFYKVLL